MYYIDLRYAVPFVINILKSQLGMPGDWDPFHTIAHLTWTRFWLLTIFFSLFSFTSIRLPLICPLSMEHIRVQFRDFSVAIAVSFIASLLFPQLLFWFAYPVIISLASCSAWLSNTFSSFLCWVQAILSTVPDLNIVITATNTTDEETPETQHDDQGVVGASLEDGGSQV